MIRLPKAHAQVAAGVEALTQLQQATRRLSLVHQHPAACKDSHCLIQRQPLLGREPAHAVSPGVYHRCVSSQLMQEDAEIEGVRESGRMRNLVCESHRPPSIRHRAIRVAEVPKTQTAMNPAADTGVVATIGQGMCPMFRRAIEGDSPFGVRQCGGELAEEPGNDPCGVMGLEAKSLIVLLLGQPGQLVAQLACPVAFPACRMNDPQPRRDLETLAAVAEVTAQFLGTIIRMLRANKGRRGCFVLPHRPLRKLLDLAPHFAHMARPPTVPLGR